MGRRGFIGIVAAIGAMIPLGRAFAAGATAPNPADAGLPRLLVVDGRFARAKGIARERAFGAASVFMLSGDVTALWYRDLEPAWRAAPVAVEGVTAPDALFCLGELARDHGLRVVGRAVVDRSGPTLIHWLIQPRSATA